MSPTQASVLESQPAKRQSSYSVTALKNVSSRKCLLGQRWAEGEIRSVLAALSRGSSINSDPLAWASGAFLLFSENASFQFFSCMNHWLEGNVIVKGVNFLFLLLWGYLEQAGEGEQRACSPQGTSSHSCVSSA